MGQTTGIIEFMDDSPFLLVKAFETHLGGTLRSVDVYTLDKLVQKLVNSLKQEIVDARLDVRDYELSETREEQLAKAKEARRRLERIRKNILAASEYDVFGAVDVAQLSAQLEQIRELLV